MAMMLELLAMKPPVLEIVPKGANFSVYGNVNVYVLDSNQTTHLAFTLGVVSNHSAFLGYAMRPYVCNSSTCSYS